MQTQAIVARVLGPCTEFMHKARWRALCALSQSALSGSAVRLSGLALGVLRDTSLRHRTKCADRLLGNVHLQAQRVQAYRVLARQWLVGLPQALIVIDWSSLSIEWFSSLVWPA